jgi:hypothetical protein
MWFFHPYNICVSYVVRAPCRLSGLSAGPIEVFIDVWLISLLWPLLILALNVFLDWYTLAFSAIGFFFPCSDVFYLRAVSQLWLLVKSPPRSCSFTMYFLDFCFFLICHSAQRGEARNSYRPDTLTVQISMNNSIGPALSPERRVMWNGTWSLTIVLADLCTPYSRGLFLWYCRYVDPRLYYLASELLR